MIGFTTIAIASAFFAAISNILARVLLRGLKSQTILSVNFTIIGLVLLCCMPWWWEFSFTWLAVSVVLIIAVLDLFSNYYYFKTFEKTDASIATPLLSLAPLFTFFFSWVLLGEASSGVTYVLAFAIVAALIIFSTDFKNLNSFKSDTLMPALTSSLFFGISAIPVSYILLELEATNAPTLFMLRAFTIALLAIPLFGFGWRAIKRQQLGFMAFRSLFVIAQYVLLYIAITRGSTGVAVTLGNITPIFVFLLGVLLLGESPTWRKAVAAGLVLVLSLLI